MAVKHLRPTGAVRLVGKVTGAVFQHCPSARTKNINADAMSRTPCQQCGKKSKTMDADIIATTELPLQAPQPIKGLREAQLADPHVGQRTQA